ncbi:UNVERIFIED_CONTAM: hypothetical protein NCL1_16409 [Trichonephila clavipes]
MKHGGGIVPVFGCKSASELSIRKHELYLNVSSINFNLSTQNMDIGDDFIFSPDNDAKRTAINNKLPKS